MAGPSRLGLSRLRSVRHGSVWQGSLGMERQVWVRHRSSGCGMAGKACLGGDRPVQAWQARRGAAQQGMSSLGLTGRGRPGTSGRASEHVMADMP